MKGTQCMYLGADENMMIDVVFPFWSFLNHPGSVVWRYLFLEKNKNIFYDSILRLFPGTKLQYSGRRLYWSDEDDLSI